MTANTTPMPPTVIPLWPDGAPGSEDWTQVEQEIKHPADTIQIVVNVTQPTLTAYFPDPALANGTAVIICPGGAYHLLAIDHEGRDVAAWLTARGFAAFVLKYRLMRTGDNLMTEISENLRDPSRRAAFMQTLRPLMLADAQQSIRLVRERAVEWQIAPDRIGIMGFSAGGMLTSSVALQHDRESRPDFAGVIYGAPGEEVAVPADAPPLFLLCADDDLMASTCSVQLYSTWKAAGRPVELHIYAKGGHGFGMHTQNLPSDRWIERFGDWLQAQGLF
ncbi:MAG: alpha/beta hydrolase [Chloroflexi bacterium]|nr:alpha/beta hydrolase [Chloroflexota bacterium]